MCKYKLIKEINGKKEILLFESDLANVIKELINIEKKLEKPYQYKASIFEIKDSNQILILKKNLTISGDFNADYL